LRPFPDITVAIGQDADAPIVYTDEDLARLLAKVERRSGRRRRHRQRGARVAACVGVAMVGWLSFLPAASGAVRMGHHPAAAAALDVRPASQSRE
jgi:hypothetical protein